MSNNFWQSVHLAFEGAVLLSLAVALSDTIAIWVKWRHHRRFVAFVTRRLALLVAGYFAISIICSAALGTLSDGTSMLLNTLLFDAIVLLVTAAPAYAYFKRLAYPVGPLFRWLMRKHEKASARRTPSLMLLPLAVLFVLCLVVSIVPLFLIPWRYEAMGSSLAAMAAANPLGTLWYVGRAAVSEEFLFRGYLLPRFESILRQLGFTRLAWPLATFFVSAWFALGHTLLMSPVWLKVSQAFLLGISLAYTTRRSGIEGAIVFHGAFNTVAVVLSLLPQSSNT